MSAVFPAAPADTALVRLERLSKRYGAFRLALADINLEIARSEFVLLSGPSGAGKSTLLRLIAGLEAPSSGRVLVGGVEPLRLRRTALAFLRRSMGIVLQEPLLLRDRSVLDNVMLPALASGHAREAALARARAALARVQLDAADVMPQELSGGELQRAALARAIVNRPALLLVDEPTAHLDAEAANGILQLLEQFAIGGVTVILASHGELVRVPARARRVALRDGKVSE